MKLLKSQMEEWIKLLRKNSDIGFVILDGEGKILTADEKLLSIWDYPFDDNKKTSIIGKYINDIICPIGSFSELLLEIRKTGYISIDEFPFRSYANSSKWAMLKGWLLQESDEDTITGWSWVDITPVCERTNSDYVKMFGDVLDFIFKNIPLMFFFWEITEDYRTKILGVNKEGEKILGYSSEEIIGKDYLDFAIPNTWQTAVKKYVKNMWENPKPYLGEHPLFTKNREEISIRWLDIPVELPMFNRLWIVSIGEDIRERLQMEHQLRESEERYRRMVEAITDYFYHVRIEDGKVVETVHSPGCEAVTGYTSEEFYQNPYLWYSMVYDEDKETVVNFANALTKGENPGPIIHRIIRKDGQIRWIRNTCLLIFDKEGKLTGYDSLIRDVTDEIIAQNALKKSEQYYRGIIENLAEGYLEIDLEGNIKFANPSLLKLLRKTKLQSLLNRKLMEFVPEEEQSKLLNLLNDIKESKQSINLCEWSIKTDDNSERKIVESSFLPIVSHQGKVKGFSGILRDITERKKQEEHIHQLQKWESLGNFVSGIAHGFNNLLMAIQGNLDLEEIECYTDSTFPYEVALYHSQIRNALDRAKELCWQLMIYTGKGFAIQKQKCNLNQIIKDILPILKTTVGEKIELNINLCEEDSKIICDEMLIRQVIVSLVTNSVEAIRDRKGTINISTRVVNYKKEMFSSFILDGKNLPAGKYVEIVVEDTGSGIRPEDLEKIFDPFYSSKFLGRGLGLSSVLGIVKGHQGGIKIESKAGEGTKMSIVLPFISSGTSEGKDSEEKKETIQDTERKVILIVEPDFMLRELTKRVLSMKGFDVIAVENTEKAIEVITSSKYKVKLIVLNITIPDKKEKKLLADMKEKSINIPVVLCSTAFLESIAEEYKDLVICSLRKPYLPTEIINIAKKHCTENN